MRLVPFLIVFPVLVFARPVWACDDDDNDSDDEDVAEVEPPQAPEPPEMPEPPQRRVAAVFDAPDLDVDIRWDIDVRSNDRDDERASATDLVRDQLDDLERRLEDATRNLRVLERR